MNPLTSLVTALASGGAYGAPWAGDREEQRVTRGPAAPRHPSDESA
jgi:hypothetical protein